MVIFMPVATNIVCAPWNPSACSSAPAEKAILVRLVPTLAVPRTVNCLVTPFRRLSAAPKSGTRMDLRGIGNLALNFNSGVSKRICVCDADCHCIDASCLGRAQIDRPAVMDASLSTRM